LEALDITDEQPGSGSEDKDEYCIVGVPDTDG
jgi:hypothetical protein